MPTNTNASQGVIILTYPGDYYLALTLINSLRYFNPDIPITILAGSGFDETDHPFKGIPIYNPKGMKADLFADWDRKFLIFDDGPYDQFLFLDADVLCLKDISGIFRRLANEQASHSIFVNLPHSFYGATNDEQYPDNRKLRIDKGQLGIVKSIQLFDAEYCENMFSRYPFNSGLFATYRSLFSYEELVEFKAREVAFCSDILKKPYASKNCDPFYGDQGKLNYLTWKKKIRISPLYPDAHYIWGGDLFQYSKKNILDGTCEIPFIHWAGCPRPSSSLFSRSPLFYFYAKGWGDISYRPKLGASVPGKDIWDYFNTNTHDCWCRTRTDMVKVFRRYWNYYL